MDGEEEGDHEQRDEVSVGRLLQGHDGGALDAEVGLEERSQPGHVSAIPIHLVEESEGQQCTEVGNQEMEEKKGARDPHRPDEVE